MNIAILGAGAWGTALAIAFSQRHTVTLWARDAQQAADMAAARRNRRYFPEVEIPRAVSVTHALDATRLADVLVVATPVAGLRAVLRAVRDADAPVVWACKGFERSSGLMPHQIVSEERVPKAAALSGPSFALEVARGLPTALTLACADGALARTLARALHQPNLRVYYSEDVIGAEVGGALKNVMAIATGICDGLGLGLNARAALITRGLAEIARLAAKLGARAETIMGLAGAGDLILTCTGDLSRNRRVGLELAGGKALERVLAELGHVAEGVETAREARRLAQSLGVELPITQAVCAVLFEDMAPQAAVQSLLARDPKIE